jgi:hypothetical protein
MSSYNDPIKSARRSARYRLYKEELRYAGACAALLDVATPGRRS